MIKHLGKNDPILGELYDDDYHLIMRVRGGLHYIRGNSKPHFSITNYHGADHEAILKYFPQFKDLVELHLSDIDGIPMYYFENGFYWLAGAIDGNFGEKYHGGCDGRSKFDCLGIFADHCRITYDEAKEILLEMEFYDGIKKEKLKEILDRMIPRWNQEAKNCIEKYGLVIYGDPWEMPE